MMPWEYAELDIRKKASLIAMIDVMVEKEKEEQARLKRTARK